MVTCKACGSSKIEKRMWVNANTLEVIDEQPHENENCYCQSCGEFRDAVGTRARSQELGKKKLPKFKKRSLNG